MSLLASGVTSARPVSPRIRIDLATPDDIDGIVSVRVKASEDLTARFGGGHWSGLATERGVALDIRQGRVIVARRSSKVVATLKLQTKKPWAIDLSYYKPARRPWYLTNMAVDPGYQSKGIGKRCVLEAIRLVAEWGGDAVRLDAYDADAGAAGFYVKCGFIEVGRATYRLTPLIYFEYRLPPAA